MILQNAFDSNCEIKFTFFKVFSAVWNTSFQDLNPFLKCSTSLSHRLIRILEREKNHMGLVVESMVCVTIFSPASKNVCFYVALSGSDELNVHILTQYSVYNTFLYLLLPVGTRTFTTTPLHRNKGDQEPSLCLWFCWQLQAFWNISVCHISIFLKVLIGLK